MSNHDDSAKKSGGPGSLNLTIKRVRTRVATSVHTGDTAKASCAVFTDPTNAPANSAVHNCNGSSGKSANPYN